MIAFPNMLVQCAQKAGIEIPQDPDLFEENKETHPGWFIFCALQLGQPMPYPSVHFDNAEVIASIQENELKTITFEEVKAKGFNTGYPMP